MAIRAAYSKDEEDQLALFLATNSGTRHGRALYKQFARTHPSHTWQSWRSHYLSDTLKMDAVIRRIQRELRSKQVNHVRRDKPVPTGRSTSQEIELISFEDSQKRKGKRKASPVDVIVIDCDSDSLRNSQRKFPAANGCQEFILERISNHIPNGIKKTYNLTDPAILICPRKLQLNALNALVPVITMSKEEEHSFFAFVSSYPGGDLRLSHKFYENYHKKDDKFSPAEYRTYYLAHHDKIENVTFQRSASVESVVEPSLTANEPELPDESQGDVLTIQFDDGNRLISTNQKTCGTTELVEEAALEIDTLSVSTGSEDDLDLDYILTCQDHSKLTSTMGIPQNMLESFLKLQENPFHCLIGRPLDSPAQNNLSSLKNSRHMNGLLQPQETNTGTPEDSASYESTGTVAGFPLHPSNARPGHLNDLIQPIVCDEELHENTDSDQLSDSVNNHNLPLSGDECPTQLNDKLPVEGRQEPHPNPVLVEMSDPSDGQQLLLPENESPRFVKAIPQLLVGEPELCKNGDSLEMPHPVKDHRTLLIEDESLEHPNNSSMMVGRQEPPEDPPGQYQHAATSQDESLSCFNSQTQSIEAEAGHLHNNVSILKRKLSNREGFSHSESGSNQDDTNLTNVESSIPSSGTITRKTSFRPVGAPNSVDEAIELLSIFLADFSDFYTPPEAVNLFRQCGDWALMFEVATLKKAEKEMIGIANEPKDKLNDREVVDQDYASRIQSMLWTAEEDALILQACSSTVDKLPNFQAEFRLLTIKRGAQAIKNRQAFLISIYQ